MSGCSAGRLCTFLRTLRSWVRRNGHDRRPCRPVVHFSALSAGQGTQERAYAAPLPACRALSCVRYEAGYAGTVMSGGSAGQLCTFLRCRQ